MLAKVSRAAWWALRRRPRAATPAGSGATIPYVSVFKRLPGSHMHVRTPIMIGVILMLVILLSGFCYYRVSAGL